MDGSTISQPCIDFEPESDRWRVKEDEATKKTSKEIESSKSPLDELNDKPMVSKPLTEVNGSAFDASKGHSLEGSPKVNGELEQTTDSLSDFESKNDLDSRLPLDTQLEKDMLHLQKDVADHSKNDSVLTLNCQSDSLEQTAAIKTESDNLLQKNHSPKESQESDEISTKEGLDSSPKSIDDKEVKSEGISISPEDETKSKKDESDNNNNEANSSEGQQDKEASNKTECPDPSLEVSGGKKIEAGSEVDPCFPSFLSGAIMLGGYRPAKNIQKELKLENDEALLEAPSFVVPLLIKKQNIISDSLKEEDVEDKENENSKENKERDKEKGYFGKTIGKFLIGLGLSRASECYQRDMTRVKLWQLKKEGKSQSLEEELQMHKNAYNQARIANEPFKFKNKKCEFCDFQSESLLVMDHHYSTPHLNFRKEYKCNYCTYMSRDPKSILFHFEAMHGRRAILEMPIQFYQCPFCSFETHLKTKASSHINKCQKFFAPARNQLPSADFPYPALTAKPLTIQEIKAFELATAKAAQAQNRSNQFMAKRGRKPGHPNIIPPQLVQGNKYLAPRNPSMPLYHQLASQTLSNTMDYNSSIMQKPKVPTPAQPPPSSSSLHFPHGLIITKSKPSLSQDQSKAFPPSSRPVTNASHLKRPLPTSLYTNSDSSKGKHQGNAPIFSSGGIEITSTNSNKPIITIQPTSGTKTSSQNPPLPKLQGPFVAGQRVPQPQSKHTTLQGNSYVICEICDAYIKDLEQLRSHMQTSHKIKIHPKMLANRPPLNCQKCHWRFFTDQGLERHLLGAHGLVTSNMQDMANKNQDCGRCTICGGIFACKLVAHMSRVHKVTLKPAHLSYKCTVCSTTFILYRLFENHVYTVHSGGNKRSAEDSSNSAPPAKKKAAHPTLLTSETTPSAPSSAIDTLKLGNSISITVIKKEEDSKVVTPSSGEIEKSNSHGCSICQTETKNITKHILENHMRKCAIKLCRIEKCEKCLSSFDGMVVLHTSDFGLDEGEEDEDSADESTSNKDTALENN